MNQGTPIHILTYTTRGVRTETVVTAYSSEENAKRGAFDVIREFFPYIRVASVEFFPVPKQLGDGLICEINNGSLVLRIHRRMFDGLGDV